MPSMRVMSSWSLARRVCLKSIHVSNMSEGVAPPRAGSLRRGGRGQQFLGSHWDTLQCPHRMCLLHGWCIWMAAVTWVPACMQPVQWSGKAPVTSPKLRGPTRSGVSGLSSICGRELEACVCPCCKWVFTFMQWRQNRMRKQHMLQHPTCPPSSTSHQLSVSLVGCSSLFSGGGRAEASSWEVAARAREILC